jgi:hypothetical protein
MHLKSKTGVTLLISNTNYRAARGLPTMQVLLGGARDVSEKQLKLDLGVSIPAPRRA